MQPTTKDNKYDVYTDAQGLVKLIAKPGRPLAEDSPVTERNSFKHSAVLIKPRQLRLIEAGTHEGYVLGDNDKFTAKKL